MIVPRPDKVVIEPIYDPDKIGHIYIPDVAKERCDQGIVKYVGAACKYLKIGDWVLFPAYAGENIELDGEGTVIFMPEKLVLGIVGDSEWSTTSVPGLFFRTKEGEYIHATVETAIKLISHAAYHIGYVRPSLKPKTSKIHSERVTLEQMSEIDDEYDEMDKLE